MTILINDIKSDKENILRYVTSILNSQLIINKVKIDNQIFKDYQKFSNQYIKQLRKILNSIVSNYDYKIKQVNNQLDELVTYFNGVSSILKITTSDLLIKDITKVLTTFVETKFSDLLKIDII